MFRMLPTAALYDAAAVLVRAILAPAVLAGVALAAMLVATGVARAEAVTGETVFNYCESCHGKRGAGGENGKYPRIAGLPQAYIGKQLHAFKSQQRMNKPMIPIFKHHRFDAEVISAVSAYVAGMRPPGLSLWPYEPDPKALEAFASRADFKAAGAKTYTGACVDCHGADGKGSAAGAPPLVDQYPAYLSKQIADFANGRRSHADSDRCASVTPAQADAVIAHLVEIGR